MAETADRSFQCLYRDDAGRAEPTGAYAAKAAFLLFTARNLRPNRMARLLGRAAATLAFAAGCDAKGARGEWLCGNPRRSATPGSADRVHVRLARHRSRAVF